jgi:putative flippase GtrA
MKKMIKTLSNIFTGRDDYTYIQFIRYLIVAAVSLLIDSFILFVLTECFQIHYLISGIAGYTTGLIVNYILSVIWVFQKKKYKNKFIEILIFVIIGFIGMGLNEFFLWFFTEILLLYYMISRGISAVFGYIFKFIARKYMLFTTS